MKNYIKPEYKTLYLNPHDILLAKSDRTFTVEEAQDDDFVVADVKQEGNNPWGDQW